MTPGSPLCLSVVESLAYSTKDVGNGDEALASTPFPLHPNTLQQPEGWCGNPSLDGLVVVIQEEDSN